MPSAKSHFIVWMQIYLAMDKNPLLKIEKNRDSKMNWYYDQNGGGMYIIPMGFTQTAQCA
jgi:hypothetical protein